MKNNLSYKLLLIGLMVIFAVATGLTHAFAQEPPVITSFTATAVDSSRANLGWSASGEGISRYLLYNYETETYIYDGLNYGFSHTGLSLDTTVYTYALWAYNDAGWSAQANTSVTLLTVPVITSFTATAVDTSQIDLTWSASGEGIDGYLLWNRETNSYIYSGTDETFSHTGLSGNNVYNYVLWAHNSAGWSSQADTSATTLSAPDTTPPGSITDLAVSSIRTNSVDLTWTAPGDDGNTGTAISYDVRYSISPISESNWASASPANIPEALLPSIAGTVEVAGLIGLSPGTTYYFAIKTSDEVPNVSGLSNVASGSTSSLIEADVFVDPPTKTVNQGETFDINVVIDPHGISISGAQADISFDPAIFKVNSITEGNLFKQNGASTYFFISKGIDNSLGTAGSVVCAILGPHSVSTKGTFFIINATAIGTGTSGINLSNVKISDPAGQAVPLNTTNGSVTVLPAVSGSGMSISYDSKDKWLILAYTEFNVSTGKYLTYLKVMDTNGTLIPPDNIKGLNENPYLVASNGLNTNIGLGFDGNAGMATIIYTDESGLALMPIPEIILNEQPNGLSGSVKTSGGIGIPGVAIGLRGQSTATTTTDINGNYSFTGLANGAYTVTPGKTGYTFTPTSRNVTISGANATGQDFTGAVRGRIRSQIR